jgi:hypothetical protein
MTYVHIFTQQFQLRLPTAVEAGVMNPGRYILGLLICECLEYFLKGQMGKEDGMSVTSRIHKLPGTFPIFFCSISSKGNLFGNGTIQLNLRSLK